MTQRTIKFRAWDKLKNVMWLSGFDLNGVSAENGAMSITTLDEDYNRTRHLFFPDEAVLMQYTGRKDKNGKEIYESDKVRFTAPTDFGEEDMGSSTVEWNESIAGFKPFDKYKSRYCEVIGNIYENKELLK